MKYRLKELYRRAKRGFGRVSFLSNLKKTDVFIITYPRSGTTWLRALIGNALEIYLNPEAYQLGLKNHEKYVPDVNDCYFKPSSLPNNISFQPRFYSVHAPYDPRLPKVIYVVRDPRDVMVSYYHFHRYKGTIDLDLSLEDFLKRGNFWPCDWDEHVKGWIGARVQNRMIIRYEDMYEDSVGVLSKVLNFAGIHCSIDLVKRAAWASSFDNMRAEADKNPIHHKGGAENERFLRKGMKEGWKEELSINMTQYLEKKYEPIMRALNYL